MKLEKTNKEKEILLRMNNLRGVLAFVVMLSHIWGYTGIVYLVPFNKVVTIAVAFFFFLSGYGMMCSFHEKEGYLKGIIKNKVPFLLWMAVIAYVFAAILERILIEYGAEGGVFLPFGFRKFFISTNWYVYELIGFYVVFALCMKFLKDKYQVIAVGLLSLLAFFILFYSGLVEAYYNSIIGFVLGMFLGRYGCVKMMGRMRYGFWLGGGILVISFGTMFVLNHDSIGFALIRNFAAAAAILVVLYIVKNLDTDDKVLKYFSRISPEIYFYHMPICELLSQILKNSLIYAIVVIIASLGIAAIMNPLNGKIQKALKRI